MAPSKKEEGFRVTDASSGDISREGRNIFFAAVETTRMPMLVTDPHQTDNPIIFANRAFLEMTGYGAEEVVGRNCRFLQGPETDPAAVSQVREAVAQRRDVAVELINYRKNGSAFWNALFVSPVLNESGELTYFFASQLDVSRRRDAEDALRQAQKMEALGQLTGGIAHDFNNLLQVMVGYLDILQRAVDEPRPNRERIAHSTASARKAAERATTLTQQLLAFSRKQNLRGRVINLNAFFEDGRTLAEQTLGPVTLQQDLQPGLWNCRVDPTQLEVAALNIYANARDAMAGRDAPAFSVQTKNIDLQDAQSKSFEGLKPGRYVAVSFTDNGVGMPPAIAARVMDPFFTTKEEGQGTGLGLSMVYGFVRQSGGVVRVYSEEGVGTTVRMYLPADTAHAQQPSVVDAAHDQHGTERVLIVEDRVDVAALADMVLQDYGYTTAVAHSGKEALERLEAEPFDLVFTDLIMPGGMNGVVLAREVRRRWPDTKVLLTTGYAENSIERTDSGGSELEVISKPYLPAELHKMIRRVLKGATGV